MIHIKARGGFSLVEIMVVIAIISLLSSILSYALNSTKAKAYDGQTLAEVRENQNSLAIDYDKIGLPNTGNDSTYYCLGRSASESCTFWGMTQTGHTALATTVWPTNTNIKNIGGLTYTSGVYKCTEHDGTTCTKAAIYWALSTASTCPFGLTVVTTARGVVCGQNAGDEGIDSVEVGEEEEEFEFTIAVTPALSNILNNGSSGTYSGQVTLQSGTAGPVTVSVTENPLVIDGNGTLAPPHFTFAYPGGTACTPNPICTVSITITTINYGSANLGGFDLTGHAVSQGTEEISSFKIFLSPAGPGAPD